MASVRNKKLQAPRKSDKAVASSVPSPGSRLRQAREALGMEIATLAEQLHLSKTMVQALEEENYEVLPARVFVRGYYRNFARAVNVPEEVILSEFEKRCPEGEDCTVPPAVAQGVRKEIRSSHGVVRLVTWLVVIALFTTFGLWWKSNLEKDGQASATDEDMVTAVKPETAAAASDNTLAGEQEENAADIPPESAEVPVMTAPPEQPPAEETAAQTDSSASTGNGETPAEETAPAEQTTEEEKAAPEPAPSEPAPQALSPRVVLSFKGDCWVDVRGANGSFKMVGQRQAGEEVELTGEFPYKMVLGNARNVTILIDGKPYDLVPYTRGNVAKLTLKQPTE